MVKKDENSMPEKENFRWVGKMDKFLLEAMLHEQIQGNRPDGTFTSHAYANMVKYLSEKFEIPDLKKLHITNRLKTLKKHFAECYDLFKCGVGLSGFAWKAETKKWDAEPEVWEALIEVFILF